MAWKLWLTVAALAAAPSALCGDGEAPAETLLAMAWPQDAVYKVEQRLELENTNRGAAIFAGGAGRSEMIVKGHVTITEEWTDKVTAAQESQPTEVQRAWKGSKLRAQKGPPVATSLQGASVSLTPTPTGVAVKPLKGKPGELPQKLLAAAPLDPVQLLLPAKALAVGATYEISVEKLSAFQCAICIGCSAAQGSSTNAVGVLLHQLENGSVAAIGKIIRGTLSSLEEGVATITFVDEKSFDSDAPIKGPLFDVPPTKTSITGTLTFQVAAGRPLRLEWNHRHWSDDFTPPPSIGGPTVPGFKEDWTLVKTWK